jgi:hypothetical protein
MVGEPFTLVLTCAVVENDTTTVVPDQTTLEPVAMQLPPFEVIGGRRGPDRRSDYRRFFQYEYTLRLLGEDLFGKDATIPSVQISYHEQTRDANGESVRGRDHIYTLPREFVRVLSLVPSGATDIREAPPRTFIDIEAARFRSRLFLLGASVSFGAAALVVVAMLIGLARRTKGERAAHRWFRSDRAILVAVRRDLAAVRRRSQQEGWSHELAGRALAALRIAATIALGQRVSQTPSAAGETGHDGQLPLHGWLPGNKVLLSGSATPYAIATQLAAGAVRSRSRRECLGTLKTALARFTTTQFGRDDKLEETALDETLNEAFGVMRRLQVETFWVMKKARNVSDFAAALGNRAWSR